MLNGTDHYAVGENGGSRDSARIHLAVVIYVVLRLPRIPDPTDRPKTSGNSRGVAFDCGADCTVSMYRKIHRSLAAATVFGIRVSSTCIGSTAVPVGVRYTPGSVSETR